MRLLTGLYLLAMSNIIKTDAYLFRLQVEKCPSIASQEWANNDEMVLRACEFHQMNVIEVLLD